MSRLGQKTRVWPPIVEQPVSHHNQDDGPLSFGALKAVNEAGGTVVVLVTWRHQRRQRPRVRPADGSPFDTGPDRLTVVEPETFIAPSVVAFPGGQTTLQRRLSPGSRRLARRAIQGGSQRVERIERRGVRSIPDAGNGFNPPLGAVSAEQVAFVSFA